MKLKLEVTLGNEAMQTADDVAAAIQRSLTTAAQLVSSYHVGDSFHIKDANGNTVGRWEVVEG